MYLILTGILLVLGFIHLDSVHGAVGESFKTFKNDQLFLNMINHHHNQHSEVLISPEVLDAFEEAIETSDDFSESTRKTMDWTAYHDIDVIYEWLKMMAEFHPDVTKLVVGGKTYEKRDILGLRIVTPDPNRKKKPVVFIGSGIHGREWIAPATTTYFINELLNSEDPNIRALRDTLDWHIFPSINPDGYHYSHTTERLWRKTRSRSSNGCYGVDGNRNFDYNWGESRPWSDYIKSLGQILAYIEFHSTGPCLIIPFGDGEHAANHEDLVAIGKSSLKFGEEASGLTPYAGPATARDIFYKVSGGSVDWAVSKQKVQLGFSYELRGTLFDWPKERIAEQGVEVTQMIRGLFVKAKKLRYYI